MGPALLDLNIKSTRRTREEVDLGWAYPYQIALMSSGRFWFMLPARGDSQGQRNGKEVTVPSADWYGGGITYLDHLSSSRPSRSSVTYPDASANAVFISKQQCLSLWSLPEWLSYSDSLFESAPASRPATKTSVCNPGVACMLGGGGSEHVVNQNIPHS